MTGRLRQYGIRARAASCAPPNIGLLVLLVVLALAGCTEEVPEPEPVERPVKLLTLQAEGVAGEHQYPATVKAAQEADMGFEVPGRVLEFFVREGQTVAEGEALARLDDRDYQADLEQAKANQRKAAADLRRGLSVYREDAGAISKESLDSYRRAKEVADAGVLKAQKAVDDTVLRAPFDGYVARKLVEDFAQVTAKQPVLILQDVSHLEVEVNVPERDVVAGERGRTVEQITERFKPEVAIASLPGARYPARVSEFATTADPTTRTFAVRLVFERPDDVSILPGMTARVHVTVPQEGGWRIPAAAVASSEEYQAFVWQVDTANMTVSRTPVELGVLYGSEVEILAGLESGDVIAVSGLRALEPGMKIRPYQP